MGTFSDHTSNDRIIFSVFTYENSKEITSTSFLLLTQNTSHYLFFNFFLLESPAAVGNAAARLRGSSGFVLRAWP